ncbi:IS21 family transposase, partial [Burkholderia cenocepacia]
MFEYRQVLVRMRQGDSDRDIARGGLMGRKKLTTVRREAEARSWLDPVQPLPDDATIAGVFGRTPHLPHTCVSTVEPYREQVREWLAAGVQGTTIHAALQRNHGYAGSYCAVKRMLRHLAAERSVATTTILDFAPADAAQVDFGAGPVLTVEGIAVRTWIFVMTLCWSRHQYAEIVLDQTVETWLASHRRAFEWFGGCPDRVIIDNAKCAIIRACRYEPAVQRSYAALAEGYGFRIDACPPHDPQKKGVVESGVKYVKKSFVPLREFRDLADANRQLREWVMQQAGTRIHGTVHERPLTRFGVERPLLAALPDVPPVLSVWKEVAVHRDGHVVYKHALYSAPFTLVGKSLWLKATDTVIQLFHRHELVATHP